MTIIRGWIKKRNTDLTEGKVWKVIIRFALPLLIGNLLQQFYNITDSIIVGQFLGKEALAAVSASFFIYYFIISFVIGVGSGTTVVISQLFGAKQYQKVQLAFSSFFIFMLVGGVILSIAGIIFAEPVFRLTNTPEEVIPQAVSYFRIYIGGTFLFVTFNSIISILRGVGESVRPMLFILITTVLNIAFDLLFILVFKWGIEGCTGDCHFTGDRHVYRFSVCKQHAPIVVHQKARYAIRLETVQRESENRTTDKRTAMRDRPRADSTAGDCEQFRDQYADSLRGCRKNRHDHHPGHPHLIGGAGGFLRTKHRSRETGPGKKGVRFTMYTNIVLGLLTFAAVYLFGDEMMKVFTKDADVVAIGKEYLLIIGGFFIIHGALNVYNGALRELETLCSQ